MSADRSTPDLTFVNLIHQALRADGIRLVATARALEPDDPQSRLTGLRDYFDRYREQLVAHHTHEDRIFFPALAAKVGDDRMDRGELVSQHEQLDEVLQAIGDCLDALTATDGDFAGNRDRLVVGLSTMVERLGTHLDLEERTALPLMQSEFPVKEYDKLEAQARRATPRAQSAFMIPWLAEHASPEQRAAWFRSVPPLRIVYALNRRRYRRLDAALVPAG